MESVLIVGIVFFSIYKVIELFVRQKERKLMISKMGEISPEMAQSNIHSFNLLQNESLKGNNFFSLRFGAIAIGIGLGWLLGLSLNEYMYESNSFSSSDINSAYIATIALCTGIALIIVYLIERISLKSSKKGE